MAYVYAKAGWFSYFGLFIGTGHMIWQLIRLDIDNASQCWKVFQSNSDFGFILFIGLLIDILIKFL